MRRSFSALPALLLALGSTACAIESPEPPKAEPLGKASSAQTVGQAANNSCGTAAVKGLSDQIIAQAACIEPDAFVKVPALPNVTMGSGVFPYLEKPARDAFVSAANAHPNTHLGVNSMLRSIAQQYLLYHWYQTGTCNIGLAAKPGNSNHESGLAFDTSDYNAWKSALTSAGFKWLGSSDVVHFDYVGAGAVDYRGTDVLAFQQLWNKNHPDDKISEDGDWGPQTESKMAASPAEGFPMPVVCEAAPPETPDVWLSADVTGATDTFVDGASMGVPDTFEGDASTISFRLVNKGQSPATKVTVGVELDGAYLEASDYLIESDWMNDGAFEENDANTLATNPPHGEPLLLPDGTAGTTLDLNQLSPGETKRITLTMRALKYSVDHESPAGVRVFVKEIPGAYAQTSYGGDATNTGDAQTFNGGRLEVAAEEDVYSRTRWAWNSNRLEGFTAAPGGTVTATGTTLESVGAFVRSPVVDVASGATLTLRASRTGGTGAAKIAVLANAGDDPAKAKAVALDLPADGKLHDVSVELAGSFAAFAILPFDGASGTLVIDSGELDDGSSSSGVGGGGGEGGKGANADPSGDLSGSCSCSAVGDGGDANLGALLGVVGLAALAARGRRRR